MYAQNVTLLYVHAAWFVAALLFIFGLKGMGSPVTARRGIVWAGYGMLLAVFATLFYPNLHNLFWIILALIIGGAIAWVSGKKVAMTDMPQMVAIYNGMGGGAAAAIAAIEFAKGYNPSASVMILAVLGAFIGSVSFTGSCVAWAKLCDEKSAAFALPKRHEYHLVDFIHCVWRVDDYARIALCFCDFNVLCRGIGFGLCGNGAHWRRGYAGGDFAF